MLNTFPLRTGCMKHFRCSLCTCLGGKVCTVRRCILWNQNCTCTMTRHTCLEVNEINTRLIASSKICMKTQKSLRRTAPLNICRLRNLYRHCFPAVAYTFRGYILYKSPRSEKSQRCIGSQTAGNCLLVMMTIRDSVRRSRPLPFRSMSLPDRHCTIHLLVQIYTFRGYRLCKSPHSHSKIQRCIGSQKTTRCLLMMLRMRGSSCKLRKSWHLPPLSTSLLDSQCTRYFLNRWRTFLLDNGCNLF